MELRQYFVTRKTPIDSKDYKTNVLTPWLHNSLTPESWANAKLELHDLFFYHELNELHEYLT